MGDAGDRVLIAVQLDPAVLADGAAGAPQKQGIERVQISDAALVGLKAVAEAGIGALAGSGVDAGVVFQFHPGPEGGVQLVDGAHAGDLGLALELVLDDLVGGLDLALAVGLIGWMADVLDVQFDQDGEQVAGDVNLAAVHVDAHRDAIAQQAVAETVEQGGQLLVEVILAEQDFAGEVVDPQEQVGFLAARGGVEPDAVAGVGLHQGEGVGRLEGTEGGASIVGEHEVAGALGEAAVGQEAVHGAIRDARDPGAEFGVGGEQLAQLRDAYAAGRHSTVVTEQGADQRPAAPRRRHPQRMQPLLTALVLAQTAPLAVDRLRNRPRSAGAGFAAPR